MSVSVLSRLAVALLVAMGFVVPTEVVRRDEVVQVEARVEVVAAARRLTTTTPVVVDQPPTTLNEAPALIRRVFLWNRAWLN